MTRISGRAVVVAVAVLFAGGLGIATAPVSGAICGSLGGRHVDVSGCADPLYEMNYVDAPPPPTAAPPGDVPPPPPLAARLRARHRLRRRVRAPTAPSAERRCVCQRRAPDQV